MYHSSVYELVGAGLVFFFCLYCTVLVMTVCFGVQHTKSAVCMVVSLKTAHRRFDLLYSRY